MTDLMKKDAILVGNLLPVPSITLAAISSQNLCLQALVPRYPTPDITSHFYAYPKIIFLYNF